MPAGGRVGCRQLESQLAPGKARWVSCASLLPDRRLHLAQMSLSGKTWGPSPANSWRPLQRCQKYCEHREESSVVVSYSISSLPLPAGSLGICSKSKFVSLPFVRAESSVNNWALKLSQIPKSGNCTGHILQVQCY